MQSATTVNFGAITVVLYLNELTIVSTTSLSVLFADDTNIFMSGKNLPPVAMALNAQFDLKCPSCSAATATSFGRGRDFWGGPRRNATTTCPRPSLEEPSPSAPVPAAGEPSLADPAPAAEERPCCPVKSRYHSIHYRQATCWHRRES